MFFHVPSFSFIFLHFLSFLPLFFFIFLSFFFQFFIFLHFLSFSFIFFVGCSKSDFFSGLKFVTISLDSSYVKNQFLGPSRVVYTPFGPSFPFLSLPFFSPVFCLFSCLFIFLFFLILCSFLHFLIF